MHLGLVEANKIFRVSGRCGGGDVFNVVQYARATSIFWSLSLHCTVDRLGIDDEDGLIIA